MSKKKYTSSNELYDPKAEGESATIERRLPSPHNKPDHKPSESGKGSISDESQDADRHNKVRHNDSGK